eukprot:scaffold41985_cov49-Attheya_sp.AAC.2
MGLGLEPPLSKLPILILTFFDGSGSGLVYGFSTLACITTLLGLQPPTNNCAKLHAAKINKSA